MIFVPRRDGINRRPREFSATEEIANGANVPLRTLKKLDAVKL